MKKTKKFEWNKATPLSKYFAMALFVVLPFMGFLAGMSYQGRVTSTQNDIAEDISRPTIDPKQFVKVSIPANWKTYKNAGLTFRYPVDWSASSLTKLISNKGSELNLYLNVDYVDDDCQKYEKEETVNLSGKDYTIRYFIETDGDGCKPGRKTISSFIEAPNSDKIHIFIFHPTEKYYENDKVNFLTILSSVSQLNE